MKKSILITGVAGLIGGKFADWVLEEHPEYEVVGIDNMFGGYIENVDNRVILYRRELSIDKISDIFDKHEFEYVFHFAAYAAEGLSPFIRKFNYSNNVLSTVNVINECISHKVKRLVYTSSMSVYGWGEKRGELFVEDAHLEPIDPYAISKYACELDIKVAGEQHGLDWCIIRPHNVYGPKQNIWDKYRNAIGIWMYKSIKGLPITIYGDGEQTRAFSYIDDCVPCFWRAATYEKASKEIVNLGGLSGISINDAAKIVSKITGNDKIVHLEGRHEVKHAVPDPSKSIRVLDYEQKTSLEEGIKEMWEWAKVQPDRKQFKWENYEITDGLYSYWK